MDYSNKNIIIFNQVHMYERGCKGGDAISPIFGLRILSKIKHGIYQISAHLLKVEKVYLLKTNIIFNNSSVTMTTIHHKNSLSMNFLNFL